MVSHWSMKTRRVKTWQATCSIYRGIAIIMKKVHFTANFALLKIHVFMTNSATRNIYQFRTSKNLQSYLLQHINRRPPFDAFRIILEFFSFSCWISFYYECVTARNSAHAQNKNLLSIRSQSRTQSLLTSYSACSTKPKSSEKDQFQIVLYCIVFQITNQDRLRIGPFLSLRFRRAYAVRS